MPEGFPGKAAFAFVAIGLAANPAFSLPSDPASLEFASGLEVARLAGISSVPIVYFSQTAALCRECWAPRLEAKSAPKDSLCRRIMEVDSGFQPSRPMTTEFTGQVNSLRRQIVEAFAGGFRADSLFLQADWSPRLRLAAGLDRGGFLEWASSKGSVHDSLTFALKSASDSLRIWENSQWPRKSIGDSGGVSRPPSPARAFDRRPRKEFLNLLIPDLDVHLDMDRWSRISGQTALCLRNFACRDLFTKYELEKLYEQLPDDSLRQKIPVPWESAFIHKMKRCLADAIWFPDGNPPSGFGYSGFFFQMNFKLGGADSLLISRSIASFGKEYAYLRQRVGDANWDRSKWRLLDSLAGRKAWTVFNEISPPMRNFLTHQKDVDDLVISITGARYPDFFGDMKVAQRLEQVVSSVDSGSFFPWASLVFPFLTQERLRNLSQKTQSGKRSVRPFLKTTNVLEKNYILFVMGRTLHVKYKGNLRGLRQLLESERKL